MAGQEVAELFATLRLQVDGAAFKGVQRAFGGIKDTLVDMRNNIVGAFAISQVAQFTRETLAALPAIGDVARKAGITTDALQELRFAFNNSGAEQSELDQGLVKLNRNMAEALKGNKDMAETFSKLGVKIKDSDGKVRSASDAFLDIADGIAKLKDPATQAEVAMTLLGSAGPSLVQGLEQGKDGIVALTQEAKRLGLTIDKETIDKAGEADDVLNNLSAVIKTGFMAVIAESADIIKEFGKAFIEVTVYFRKSIKLIKENSKVIKFLAATIGTYLVASFVAAQSGIVILAAKYVASMLSMQIATLGVVGGMKAMSTMITGLIARVVALALPFIKIAAIAAVIVLVVDEIWTYFKGGETLIGRLAGRWNEFAEALFKDADEDNFWLTSLLKSALGYLAKFIGLMDGWIDGLFRKVNYIMEMIDTAMRFISAPFKEKKIMIDQAAGGLIDYVKNSETPLLAPARAGAYLGEKTAAFIKDRNAASRALTMNSPVTVNMNGTFNGEPNEIAKSVGQAVTKGQSDIARASLDTLMVPNSAM